MSRVRELRVRVFGVRVFRAFRVRVIVRVFRVRVRVFRVRVRA